MYIVTVCACHIEIKGYLLTYLTYSSRGQWGFIFWGRKGEEDGDVCCIFWNTSVDVSSCWNDPYCLSAITSTDHPRKRRRSRWKLTEPTIKVENKLSLQSTHTHTYTHTNGVLQMRKYQNRTKNLHFLHSNWMMNAQSLKAKH